jgi:hypothetical protein
VYCLVVSSVYRCHTSNLYFSCCHTCADAAVASDTLPSNLWWRLPWGVHFIPQNKPNGMRIDRRDTGFPVPIRLFENWDSQRHWSVLLRHHAEKWCMYVLEAVKLSKCPITNYWLLFFLRRLTTVVFAEHLGSQVSNLLDIIYFVQ